MKNDPVSVLMQYERGATYRQPRRIIALRSDWPSAVLFDHLLSLSRLFDRSRMTRDGEQWFYRSNEALCEYMGVGNAALLTMRKRLTNLDLIHTKTFKRADTGKRCVHYRIDIDGLGALLRDAAEASPQISGAEISPPTKSREPRFPNLESKDLVGSTPLPKETALRNKTPQNPPLAFRPITREEILDGAWDGKPKKALSRSQALIRALFEEWALTNRKGRCLPTPGGVDALKKALGRGYAPSMVLKACEGIALSKHHRGENDRNETYNELSNVCAKDNIEKFAKLWELNVAPRRARGDKDDKPRLFAPEVPVERGGQEWSADDAAEFEAALEAVTSGGEA